MQVPQDHPFAKDHRWEGVRDWTADFLIAEGISVSSIDFVRFTWLNEFDTPEIESNEEEESDADTEDEDSDVDVADIDAVYASLPAVESVEYGDRYYTNPTIWIGVLPLTLTTRRASELNLQIRAYLDQLGVTNVDIAFRESVVQPMARHCHGPELYGPTVIGDDLEDTIGNVSTALGLPIGGFDSIVQGTLGPYFQHNNKLYAITARHNLLKLMEGNDAYKYHPHAPKRRVVLMVKTAFSNYQAKVQHRISTLNIIVRSTEKSIVTYQDQVANQIGLPESQHRLQNFENLLDATERRITKLQTFYATLLKKWSMQSNRVIGHVVWAPSIGVSGSGPQRFTRDVCVIELYKPKFSKFAGNVLSLGPELDEATLTELLYGRIDISVDFAYPERGLLPIRGMQSADDISNPDTLDIHGDRVRRVLKRGFATGATVGTLNRFRSFARRYLASDVMESIELPILPHESAKKVFCMGGDSGSLVVSPTGEFVGLITGGVNNGTWGSDITYATLFKDVWGLVLEEFPGANLYWDDIPAFLADDDAT